jgi:PAS domain S-box-containing protein
MRVGELARRTDVGISTLRAWERRFGLLRPERSASGQRLYTEDDVQRVAAVSRLVAEGLTLSAAIGRINAAGTGALSTGEGESFLLHQVVQAADQGIWVSHDGRTRFANRRMAELVRCSIDELLTRPVVDFVHPDAIEALKEHGKLGREGHRQRYEIRMLRADSSSFLAEVSTTPLRDPTGAYKGAVAVVTDVTARSQAESDARFRTALLDSIGEAVLASRTDGTIVYANPAAERLLGWRPAELVGQNGLELLAGPGGDDDGYQIHAKLLTNLRHSGEVTLPRRDGTKVEAHLSGSPVLDAQGDVVGVIGVLSDHSERDRWEDDARAWEQQAETVALLGARALRDRQGDRERVLTEVVEGARRVLHAEHAALMELTPDRDELVLRVAAPPMRNRTVIPAGTRSFAGYTVLAGKVVSVEDASLDRRFEIATPPGLDFAIVSAIAAPVLGPSGVLGVLIASCTTPHAFGVSAAHFMQSMANVAGTALQQP